MHATLQSSGCRIDSSLTWFGKDERNPIEVCLIRSSRLWFGEAESVMRRPAAVVNYCFGMGSRFDAGEAFCCGGSAASS